MAYLAGAFSAKAAKRANRKLKAMRGFKAAALRKDEGGTARAEIPTNELNHPTNQGGGAMYGRRVSSAGGAGRERQEHAGHVDKAENARRYPAGSHVSASHPGHPTASKGPIAPSGPRYGGGGKNTQ